MIQKYQNLNNSNINSHYPVFVSLFSECVRLFHAEYFNIYTFEQQNSPFLIFQTIVCKGYPGNTRFMTILLLETIQVDLSTI